MRDKKIKKKLQEKLIQPSITFDEWAAKYGVSLPDPQSSPEKQKSGNAAKGGEAAAVARRGNTVVLIAFALFFTAAIVCLVGKSIFGWNLRPKFGAGDVRTERIEWSEIANTPDIYLPSLPENASYGTFAKDILKKDETMVLSYKIEDNAISLGNDKKDDFYFTYRIKLYENYEFSSWEKYKSKTNTDINGKKVYYSIDENYSPVTGYASFSLGDYDYFVEATAKEETTVINESSFITLLETILK